MHWKRLQLSGSGLIPLVLFLMLSGTTPVLLSCGEDTPTEETAAADQLWTCGMHPDVLVSEPGQCPICNMDLVEVKTETDTSMASGEMSGITTTHTHAGETGEVWTCPMHEQVMESEPGLCPICNMDLVKHAGQTVEVWTCPMHEQVVESEPGLCPICNMDLVKVEKPAGTGMAQASSIQSDQSSASQDKKVLYWRAPMDPTFISEKPGKSPMGMDLVPVYEGEEVSGGPTIVIDPVTIQNIGVRTTPVHKVNLYRSIRTVSHLDYNEETFSRVNIKYSGWIEQLHADQTGQAIRKGQPMLDIYSPELVSTQEEYLLAYRNRQKLNDSAFEEIVTGAQSLLDATKRRLLYWDITEAQIQALETRGTISKTMTLYAPADGIVIEKMAEQGMRVTPDMDLFRIADLSTIWVYAHVYEYEAPWIKQGQLVEMELPYNPGKIYQGRVDYVYPYLDQKTRDVKIRLVFSNPRLDLKPNMYANVRIDVSIGEEVTVVPNHAVIRTGKRNLVFVALGNGRFEPRDVVLGLEGQDGLMQVMAGVVLNEQVVTSAQFLMDSESRLREAIQKMLDVRRSSGSGTPEMQPKVIQPQPQH